MIKVENLYKSFGDKVILDNISFNVELGDKLAIIGQSGVGKSVLIKHLNGLLKIDKGNVTIDDNSLKDLSYQKLQDIRKKIAMVFQFGALLDSLTIKENIQLALDSISSINIKETDKKIKEVLKLVDLEGIENLMPSEISGGMKKRVGIARALSVNPKYILYDEPTTGLDPINTDKINSLINRVSSKKTASIIVTHEIKTVFSVANKVLMLCDGSIIFSGTPDELKRSENDFIKYFISGNKGKK